MNDPQRRARRLGMVGAGVGVATIGAIAVIVATGDRSDEPGARPLAATAPTPKTPKIERTLPVPTRPAPARPDPTPPVTVPTITAPDQPIYGGLVGHQVGSGWGTIDPGRYGLGARRVSSVRIAQPVVTPADAGNATPGTLDKAIVRRYVKRNAAKLEYCYERELLAKPGLAGTVQARFTITESGFVDGATASGVDPTVAACVVSVFARVEFPRPRGAGGVTVAQTLTYRRTP